MASYMKCRWDILTDHQHINVSVSRDEIHNNLKEAIISPKRETTDGAYAMFHQPF